MTSLRIRLRWEVSPAICRSRYSSKVDAMNGMKTNFNYVARRWKEKVRKITFPIYYRLLSLDSGVIDVIDIVSYRSQHDSWKQHDASLSHSSAECRENAFQFSCFIYSAIEFPRGCCWTKLNDSLVISILRLLADESIRTANVRARRLPI